jgi:hypothetical protein
MCEGWPTLGNRCVSCKCTEYGVNAARQMHCNAQKIALPESKRVSTFSIPQRPMLNYLYYLRREWIFRFWPALILVFTVLARSKSKLFAFTYSRWQALPCESVKVQVFYTEDVEYAFFTERRFMHMHEAVLIMVCMCLCGSLLLRDPRLGAI